MSDLTFHHTQRPLRIGITGGIGSGKTTVCHIFESLGIPVYYADYWAKWLLENDPELQKKIVELFGEKAYINGKYNKELIAEQVFSNPTKLAQLNAIAHPAVELHSREWHAKQKNVPYTLKEAALIIETGGQYFLDALILVSAPEEIRINRVMQRDGSSKDAVLHRISNQMPEADKLKYADFIIKNDGQELLIPQVLKIHQYLIR